MGLVLLKVRALFLVCVVSSTQKVMPPPCVYVSVSVSVFVFVSVSVSVSVSFPPLPTFLFVRGL